MHCLLCVYAGSYHIKLMSMPRVVAPGWIRLQPLTTARRARARRERERERERVCVCVCARVCAHLPTRAHMRNDRCGSVRCAAVQCGAVLCGMVGRCGAVW